MKHQVGQGQETAHDMHVTSRYLVIFIGILSHAENCCKCDINQKTKFYSALYSKRKCCRILVARKNMPKYFLLTKVVILVCL